MNVLYLRQSLRLHLEPVRKSIFLFIFVLGVTAGTSSAQAQSEAASAKVGNTYSVPIQLVGPTQQQIGQEVVDKMLEHWASQAKGNLQAFEKIVLEQTRAPVPGIVAPALGGSRLQFKITDGHHRASALDSLLHKDFSRLPDKVKAVLKTPEAQQALRLNPQMNIAVKVEAVYRTPEQAALGLARSGKGYLSENVRQIPGFSQAVEAAKAGRPADARVLVQAYSKLPPSFGVLQGNPMRSAVGNAFHGAGLDPALFNDYVEFFVGEQLQKKGLIVTAQNAVSEQMRKEITNKILGDPKILELLKQQARPGKEAVVIQQLQAARLKAGPSAAASGSTAASVRTPTQAPAPSEGPIQVPRGLNVRCLEQALKTAVR